MLSSIEKVAKKIAPGRTPTFTEAHIIKALEIIEKRKTVGRIILSRKLEMSEGTTRTLVRHLRNEEIIQISKYGITLSQQGKKLLSSIRSRLSESIEVPSSSITVGPFNFAILVKDMANRIERGLEQRDIAVKAGASGATTLVFSRNKLTLPAMDERFFKSSPNLHDLLMAKLDPKENDVIIIGSGKNKMVAEIGAKMVALELLKS